MKSACLNASGMNGMFLISFEKTTIKKLPQQNIQTPAELFSTALQLSSALNNFSLKLLLNLGASLRPQLRASLMTG
jgi:hypothetical protein